MTERTRDPVWQTLNELRSACDEMLQNHPGSAGWTRTFWLSGTRRDRSAAWLRKLMALGYVEGRKSIGCAQAQWRWLITDAGRRYVTDGHP